MTKPGVSIIIRCFNEEAHIGRLLTGVYEQTVDNVEVIIVDSGSTDRTLSIASSFPVIIRTIPSEEFSFGRALNAGCGAARGEYLVFASAHVYPNHRRWLEYLIAPFRHHKVALTYGRQRGNRQNKFSEHRIFAAWYPDQSVHIQNSPFCNNANAAIRKRLWHDIPFNESLTGLEDLEWAKRAIGAGYCLSYVAEAEVVHVHNERYTGIFNRYYRESIVFYQLFPEQKFNLRDFCWLWFMNTATDYLHAVRERSFMRNAFAIPLFRMMQFWGTYRGYCRRDPVSAALRERFYYPNGRNHRTPSQGISCTSDDDYIDYLKVNNENNVGQSH
ncbi:MAG: glycosyltransferase family 2 protein [Nitrospiraceae bacterium]|nr:MAG: glycosyltransferase family 2 protein [Nitrospiraceae bacterium]